ncbi:MAG: hypothetical protein QW474_03945 [Candidatus Aenigmatarchaeota archaeon]
MARFRIERSFNLLESLAWRKSSEGFRTKITTVASIAKRATTTRSSTKVKEFSKKMRFLAFFEIVGCLLDNIGDIWFGENKPSIYNLIITKKLKKITNKIRLA